MLAALSIEELMHEVTEERRNGYVRRWSRLLLGVLRVDLRVDDEMGWSDALVESREASHVAGEGWRQYLERDVTNEPRVPRPIDFAHPTHTKQ